jgi:Tol biopolymer transport system component
VAGPRIAFEKQDNIWTISSSGSGLQRLTRGSAQDGQPVWKPGRKTIAFLRGAANGSLHTRIMLVPAEGGTARPLTYSGSTTQPSDRVITGLAYSPDGTRLAFADLSFSSSRVQGRVVVIDLKTRKTVVLLRRSAGFDVSCKLSWSPDGKMLLVSHFGQDAEGSATWLLDVASREVTPLGIADACSAAWLPDSQRLLTSTLTQAGSSVLLAKRDGSVLSTLVTGGGAFGPSTAAASVEDACSSPGGHMVVYATLSPKTGATSLWLMGIDGSNRHRLTAGISPAW